MTKTEKKIKAQVLIMQQLAKIGYGYDWEEFVSDIGDEDEAHEIVMKQMNRVAKMFGYQAAWFG